MSFDPRNIVLHNDINADRVYISSIREEFGGKYLVLEKEGKRGAALQVKVKMVTDDLKQAHRKQLLIASERRARSSNYIGIDEAFYTGSLTLNDPWLKPLLEVNGIALPKEKKTPFVVPVSRLPDGPEMELICVNNTGYEMNFDLGVTYLCTPDLYDNQMYNVYDKLGSQLLVFASRFRKL